jgi:hypothetical protein
VRIATKRDSTGGGRNGRKRPVRRQTPDEGEVMMIEVLSPMGIPKGDDGILAAPVASLEGRTIGFLSNNKNGTEFLYRGLEAALLEAGVAGIFHTSKPIASIAHGDLEGVARSCDVAVVALGD